MKAELSPEQLKWIKEKNYYNFKEAPKEWLESNEFMLQTLTDNTDGRFLQYASEKLKDDREIVLAAVTKSGSALEFASDKLKDDKEIVLTAVTNRGYSLQYASTKLKDDKEIVLVAVTNGGFALQYASDKLKDDKEIVLAALDNKGRALEYASDKLKDDREFILAAVKKYGTTLSYASNNLKNNREIVLEAIKNDPNSIEFVNDQLNGYPEIVLTALSQDANALYYVRSEEILKELAEKSSVGGTKINFKVQDLVFAVQQLFYKKLNDEPTEDSDETEKISYDWFNFNQIIYQNQTMDGKALLCLAQSRFEYLDNQNLQRVRGLLIEAIELNDEYLMDIISYGLNGHEYVDFSDLAEKACELLWNRAEKNYENALMVLRNENHELIPGLSNEFVLKIVQEAKELDLGYEEDKEELENFVSEAGIK